jgi:nucleoside-diphosphate-sugar epimerase
MQRVIVLGASGFLGRHVLAALAASGWAAPVAVSRNPYAAPRTSLLPHGMRRDGDASDPTGPVSTERLACNATRLADLLRVLAGADAVVNCTAGSPTDTVDVARALAQVPADCRIVHVSSMAVYGAAAGRVDEASALPDGLGGYAGAKVAAERALSGHPNHVVLRPGCIFGPGGEQWTLRIARLLRARRLGDLGAAGDGACNLAPLDDVAAAVLATLCRPVSGVAFNIALPDPPSWNAFLVCFAIALGATPVARVPARQLRLEARLAVPLHAAALALRRISPQAATRLPDALTPSLLALMRQDITLDHRRADRLLGFARTPLGTALAQAAASLRPAKSHPIVRTPVAWTPLADPCIVAARAPVASAALAGRDLATRDLASGDLAADGLPASGPAHAA